MPLSMVIGLLQFLSPLKVNFDIALISWG
jgi:hypothetical protein